MVQSPIAQGLFQAIAQPEPRPLTVQEVIQKATVALIEVLHEIHYHDITDAQTEVLNSLQREVEAPNWIQSS